MADNYYRLVCFIVNICPEPLRAFFIHLAKKDAGSSFTSLDVYLTQRTQNIVQLHKGKIIRADQLSLIFPRHGTGNESDWDVTLLVCLIKNLFPGHIQPLEDFVMTEIRNIRNNLQHISNTANISNSDFNSHWGRLESATMALAQQVFNTTEQASFKTKIDELKKNRLPDLVDCLRLWHEETVKDMANKIDDLQNEVNDLKLETRQTNSILHSVTVKKPGPAGDGDKNKRFKAVDNILKRLQENFEVTMRDLPKSFSAPAEALEIRTKLRDKHHVVVTGSYNSRYFETALAAIKEMDYNTKRCVVMQKSSDWRHIDPEDVDFVLCIDPFGRTTLDEDKTKEMADIFSNMKHTADDQDGKSIDILIVTDSTTFTECKLRHEHDILDEEVKVFEATTEEQPADLTGVACENVIMTNSRFSQEFSSLRELTDNFLRQYKDLSLSTGNPVLKAAKDTFKSKKAIVLTGTENSERTAVAVALTSSYEPSRCLLLTEPNDVKYIDWQNTCLVIIDEFAGKYRYEENEVHKWYRMFDHLFSAITKGKINVVITCEKNKLKRCIDEISSHHLLEHVVELPDRVTVIKDETSDCEGTLTSFRYSLTPSRQTETCASTSITKSSTSSFIWHITDKTFYNIKLHDELQECDIRGCCWLPSGEILLVDAANRRLKKLDINYTVVGVCEVSRYPRDVCYIGNNKAVVSSGETLDIVDVVNMRMTRSVNTDHLCDSLASHANLLYVCDFSKIYVYDINNFKKSVLDTGHVYYIYISQIAVSDDGSKIYMVCKDGLVTIDSSGNHLYTFNGLNLSINCLCVDNAGNVLVYKKKTNSILQIGSNGRQMFGVIGKLPTRFLATMCFGRLRSVLVFCERSSNNVVVLDMKKYTKSL